MADPQKSGGLPKNEVEFISDCDLLEIKEADTKPGKVSDRYRKLLEEKYGRKQPPSSNGTAEKPA